MIVQYLLQVSVGSIVVIELVFGLFGEAEGSGHVVGLFVVQHDPNYVAFAHIPPSKTKFSTVIIIMGIVPISVAGIPGGDAWWVGSN